MPKRHVPVKERPPIERFLYWVEERELIRLRRESKLPKPWTSDPILQAYRFCNIRRADDKVSSWLINNWYTPNFNHKRMVVACTIARFFNVPKALGLITEQVFGDWDPERIKRTLKKFKASGNTVFNGAYMVRGVLGMEKVDMVVDMICQPLVKTPAHIDKNSMERSVNALLPYWGFSTFMAGQVVADLRWAVDGDWLDRNTWAPLGPGSHRGMNRLHDRGIKEPLSQEQFNTELVELQKICRSKLPDSVMIRLESMDIQNCLCEVDKYERILWGEGRPKQRYNGI